MNSMNIKEIIAMNLPKIYIIVKQLSKAIPTKNLQTAKVQNDEHMVVAIPPMKPTRLVPTRAGILPNLSAIQPKTRPPKMAPQKKMDWAMLGRAAFSHTQSFWKTKKNHFV